jgi:hypothetical protein
MYAVLRRGDGAIFLSGAPLASAHEKRSDSLVQGFGAKLAASFGLASCLIGLSAGGAQAAPVDEASRATARKLGYSGVEAYQAGDFSAASDKLERAYHVLRVPSVGLWSARALAKLGKLVEASERYMEVQQLSGSTGNEEVQKGALTDVATDLAVLTPRIPHVTVQVQGAAAAEVSVLVDGTPIAPDLIGEARPVNPGRHQIEGTRGSEHAVVDVTLGEGEQKPALLRFGVPVQASPPALIDDRTQLQSPTPSKLGTQRTLALVAGGIGVVGVGIGTLFGLKSKSSHDEAAKYCAGAICTDPRGVTAGNDAHAAGNVSTIAMIVGAAGLAGGVVLWLSAPKSTEPHAELGAGFGTLQFRGNF